ncbi:MAG: cation transporter, partial [Candidatus Omnitrophica bacterium]|nr:cation transporter [Candidatus Omnitrophota bacterium]
MTTKKVLWVSCVATFVVALIEFLGGRLAHSLALIADSVHMLTD